MDSSYLDIEITNSAYLPQEIENQIEFENVLSSNELFPVVNRNNFLIHSKEQFAHVFGATSSDFDDDFFEEYSLFIWYNYCNNPKYDKKVTEMGIENNKLLMNKFNYYTTYYDFETKPWTSFYKIKKSDICDIESVFICNLVMTDG